MCIAFLRTTPVVLIEASIFHVARTYTYIYIYIYSYFYSNNKMQNIERTRTSFETPRTISLIRAASRRLRAPSQYWRRIVATCFADRKCGLITGLSRHCFLCQWHQWLLIIIGGGMELIDRNIDRRAVRWKFSLSWGIFAYIANLCRGQKLSIYLYIANWNREDVDFQQIVRIASLTFSLKKKDRLILNYTIIRNRRIIEG